MSGLIRYDAACRALAECKAIDEVKSWHDKAAAMQAYGRMAQDKQLETDAAEIRIRAERRLGEIITDQKENGGLNTGGRPSKETCLESRQVTPPTLKDAGISRDLSSRAQKLAAVPEAEFEHEVGEWRERVTAENARVTTRLELAGAREQKKPKTADNVAALTAEQAGFVQDYDAEELREKIQLLTDSLHAQHDEITSLKDRLSAFGPATEDQSSAAETIAELRQELRVAYSTVDAITQSRDQYMSENGQLKRQVAMMQREQKRAAA